MHALVLLISINLHTKLGVPVGLPGSFTHSKDMTGAPNLKWLVGWLEFNCAFNTI